MFYHNVYYSNYYKQEKEEVVSNERVQFCDRKNSQLQTNATTFIEVA